MTKDEVLNIAHDAMGFPRPKKNFTNDFKNGVPPEPSTAMTNMKTDEVQKDEMDQGDNPELSYCPSCGAKLSR